MNAFLAKFKDQLLTESKNDQIKLNEIFLDISYAFVGGFLSFTFIAYNKICKHESSTKELIILLIYILVHLSYAVLLAHLQKKIFTKQNITLLIVLLFGLGMSCLLPDHVIIICGGIFFGLLLHLLFNNQPESYSSQIGLKKYMTSFMGPLFGFLLAFVIADSTSLFENICSDKIVVEPKISNSVNN